MREYVFTVKYEKGVYPLADVFIKYPSLISTALTISMSRSGLWRVDRVTGSEEAIDRFKEAYTNPSYCIECGGQEHECDAQWEYEVITEHERSITVYAKVTKPAEYCHSVPFLALQEFGDGLLFDAQRRGPIYEWRILMPEEYPVGDLFNQLRAGIDEKTSITLRQVGTPSRWGEDVTTIADLPHNQRVVLETAVSEGYYSTPREINLEELANKINLPKSTLRYRLRRAEAWVIESFVSKQSLLSYSSEEPAVELGQE